MTTMTRTAWGLETPRGAWHQQAACAGRDPALWDITRGGAGLSIRNRVALGICLTLCPVVEQCHRDNHTQPPASIIVGGWVYGTNSRGNNQLVRPGRLAETLPETALDAALEPAPFGSNHAALRAAQALRADPRLNSAAAARQAGCSRSLVNTALLILRHRPDLAAEVLAGEVSYHQALTLARSTRDNSLAGAR